MEFAWRWERLSATEKQVAELLLEGKSNKEICCETCLSRARVQECIRRVVRKTGADSTRDAIVLLAEERETSALLRVLGQARDGVAIAQDGVCKFANEALAETHGYTSEEMVNRPFDELLAPEVRDLMVRRYEERVRGVQVPIRYRTKILCKGGETKEVEVASVGLLRYNGKPAIMAIVLEKEQVPQVTEPPLVLGRCRQPCCLVHGSHHRQAEHVIPPQLPPHCVLQEAPR